MASHICKLKVCNAELGWPDLLIVHVERVESARQHSSRDCKKVVAALGGKSPVSSADKGWSMTLHCGDLHGSRRWLLFESDQGLSLQSCHPIPSELLSAAGMHRLVISWSY